MTIALFFLIPLIIMSPVAYALFFQEAFDELGFTKSQKYQIVGIQYALFVFLMFAGHYL